jgi:endonuclease/exonuclease/phosphatase (EEP) superfamily protein YafD
MSAAAGLGRPTRRYVAAAVFTLVAAVTLLPDLVDLDRYSPFAQLVAFRPWLLLAGTALLPALLPFRRTRPFGMGLLAVLLAGAGLVLPRGIAGPAPTSGAPLGVLAFNASVGRADAAALAELIRAQRPDLVALVEAGERFHARLAPLVEPLGYRSFRATTRSEVSGSVVLVADNLGDVRGGAVEDATFPRVEVTGGRLGELRFSTFHSLAPVFGSVPTWRSELAGLRKWCAGPTPAIIAGDFNATLDHSALRDGMSGCADAANQRGAGLVPTWGPSARTRMLGPQIDHVLATGGIAAESFGVHDIPGSDHRAVLARLRLPAFPQPQLSDLGQTR